MIIALIVALIAITALLGTVMSNVEQPVYNVVKSKGNIELRDYAPMVVAEVEVSGERKPAIKKGFKILSDYIFGTNSTNTRLAMTAPVIQEPYQDKWMVRFVMPKKYALESLPKPTTQDVALHALPARRFATICFSGLVDDQKITERSQELQDYVLSEKLTAIGPAMIAFYNPPWTLPFLRRNEIMIEVRN